MFSAAVLPGAGAVLRVVRGTAGRRPVRVALLAGGLFVKYIRRSLVKAALVKAAPTPGVPHAPFEPEPVGVITDNRPTG